MQSNNTIIGECHYHHCKTYAYYLHNVAYFHMFLQSLN